MLLQPNPYVQSAAQKYSLGNTCMYRENNGEYTDFKHQFWIATLSSRLTISNIHDSNANLYGSSDNVSFIPDLV